MKLKLLTEIYENHNEAQPTRMCNVLKKEDDLFYYEYVERSLIRSANVD